MSSDRQILPNRPWNCVEWTQEMVFNTYHHTRTCLDKKIGNDEKKVFKFFSLPISLKEEGHYFPHLSDRVRDPKEFQSNLLSKLYQIIICCNMLSGSIFYVFFNCKTIGPKKIEPGRRGPKFRMNFLKIFHFLTFLELEN